MVIGLGLFLMREVPLNPTPYAPYALDVTVELYAGEVDTTPYTLHSTPYTLHPTPYTLHPSPYTLRPVPYTLHPTPYTLHPTPYTPHSKPSALDITMELYAGEVKPRPYTLHSWFMT